MSIPFIDRDPTKSEVEQFRRALSTFRDGTGWERLGDDTFAGWRQLERTVAEVLEGWAIESKWAFDVLVPARGEAKAVYGVSVKSKVLPSCRSFADHARTGGRLYLEMTNAPAQLWAALQEAGLSQDDWNSPGTASSFGNELLRVVEDTYVAAAQEYNEKAPERKLEIEKSIHLVLSSTCQKTVAGREYQWHALGLRLPRDLNWEYRSARSLKGTDDATGEVVIDWYPFSGGQLKYYPQLEDALCKSEPFRLADLPRPISIRERAARYWPEEWKATGGAAFDLPIEVIADEVAARASLTTNEKAREILTETAERLARL